MNIKRKLLLLMLLLILISAGIVVAQSSPNFLRRGSVQLSGGIAHSPNYTTNVVIGQPAIGVVCGENYKVSTGLLHPLHRDNCRTTQIWLPLIAR